LEEFKQYLQISDILNIYETIGKFLAQLHRIKFDIYGDILCRNGKFWVGSLKDGGYCDGPFNSWRELLLSLFKYYLNKISSIMVFSDLVPFCNKYIKLKIDEIYDDGPRFLHNNLYELSNILISDKKISGILDFELSMAGDYEFEIAQIEYSIKNAFPEKFHKKIFNSFIKGYDLSLSNEYNNKKEFYWFLYLIHFMNVWEFIKRKFTMEHQKRIIKETRNYILNIRENFLNES